jgi:shikimate dehydrogenase
MSHHVGLIGDPVAHSKSPALHNAAFAHYGINARYELWPTSADALAERVASLRAPNTFGANVTLPHKIAVIPLLDQLDPLVDVIGAVNTIVREPDGTLSGANTDAPAFLASLRGEAGYAPEGQTAVVLGASGAARAAVAALVGAGIAGVIVVNRTVERAEELLADMLIAFDCDLPFVATTPDDPDLSTLFENATLVVNATSLGWRADETPLDAALIPPGALVFDMVYRPTRLLREAAAAGARTHDGLGMLVRQAALAFERWTGQPGPLDVMRRALE